MTRWEMAGSNRAVRDGEVPRDRLVRRIVETAARRVNFQHLAVDPPVAGRAGFLPGLLQPRRTGHLSERR
ncbi:hypothetical protein ABT001_21395 [Streptomyces sp. NPDC002793]|uniref:hypothetical protein n=1 Tax=Streptomyces sp. NPDC002793 TaxID=3154432 RepID=UPI0033167ED9